MNLKDNKIKDFSKKINAMEEDKIQFFIGNNGGGKTRNLIEIFEKDSRENKEYVSTYYATSSILFAGILKRNENNNEGEFEQVLSFLDDQKLTENELGHVNKLLGKRYSEIRYKAYTISEILDSLNDATFEYFKEVNEVYKNNFDSTIFYYFFVIENEEVYETPQFGTGEQSLLSLYILLNRRERVCYIDEIGNYLSHVSLKNLSRLLIYSIYTKKNSFVITSNNLHIIEHLMFDFELEINIFELGQTCSPTLLTKENYMKKYEDRLPKMDIPKQLFIVEDIILKKFLEYLLKDDRTINIQYWVLGGEGKIINFYKAFSDRFNDFFGPLGVAKYICFFDGDVDNGETNYANSLFLPFPSFEKEMEMRWREEDCQQYFKDNHELKNIQIIEIIEIINNNENHVSYKKIAKKFNITDEKIFEYLCGYYTKEISKLYVKIQAIIEKNG